MRSQMCAGATTPTSAPEISFKGRRLAGLVCSVLPSTELGRCTLYLVSTFAMKPSIPGIVLTIWGPGVASLIVLSLKAFAFCERFDVTEETAGCNLEINTLKQEIQYLEESLENSALE